MNISIMPLLSALPEGRVFGLDMQTLITTGIQLLNACILAAVLGFILYKPVRKFMSDRTNRILSQMDEAKNKMAEAEGLKAQYEEKIADIETERLKILEAARQTALERSKVIIDEAREETAVMKKRAEEFIAYEKERVSRETRQYIIEVSSLMASKFVEKAIDQEAQDKLFDEAIAKLEEASWLS